MAWLTAGWMRIRYWWPAMLALSACSPGAPVVEDAWVRMLPAGSSVTAAYATIRNPGASDKVTGVSSDAHVSASLHETRMENGMTRMHHRPSVELPSGGTLRFQPGGLHVMLEQPVRTLRSGDHIMLSFKLASGATITAPAIVSSDAP